MGTTTASHPNPPRNPPLPTTATHHRPPQINQEREPLTWLKALSVRIFSPASSSSDLGRLRSQRKRKLDRTYREREQKEIAEKKSREPHACFGKWFTEIFFINRFPFYFCEGFSSKKQIISVDFDFTAKQISVNDENILRKIFYVETNGA
jgi:hypothetical protein